MSQILQGTSVLAWRRSIHRDEICGPSEPSGSDEHGCTAGIDAGHDPLLARLIQPWTADGPSASAALLFSVQMAAESACKAAQQLLGLSDSSEPSSLQVSPGLVHHGSAG